MLSQTERIFKQTWKEYSEKKQREEKGQTAIIFGESAFEYKKEVDERIRIFKILTLLESHNEKSASDKLAKTVNESIEDLKKQFEKALTRIEQEKNPSRIGSQKKES